MTYARRRFSSFPFLPFVMLVLVLAAAATPASVAASSGLSVSSAQHGANTFPPEDASEVSRQSVHEEPLWVTAARLFNFAILAGTLIYFLRSPLSLYLVRRGTEIRSDLTKAAEMKAEAERRMAEIERRVSGLPAELEALKRRGAEEIAAEEARIREAADVDRRRLVEQAQREIGLQVRIAERDLRELAADLALRIATDRIKKTMTTEDQVRLFDRYLAQLGQVGRS